MLCDVAKLMIFIILSILVIPNSFSTSLNLIFSFPAKMETWSAIDKVSRKLPAPNEAIKSRTLSSYSIFSSLKTFIKCLMIVFLSILLKLNLWTLLKIVKGIFWGSVVAKIKITCLGGSSSVFSNALNAPFESIWTSSIIYILYFDCVGKCLIFSRKSLTSSIPLLDAASISIISKFRSILFIQSWQGLYMSFECEQLIVFANILATEVLPVPCGPQNK